MIIRRASENDVPAIRECVEQAYQKYVARLGRRPAPMDANFAAEVSRGETYLATTDADELAGLITFFPTNNVILIENIAIALHHQGKGISRKLIDFCETQARLMSLPCLELYTNVLMTENLTLYPHLGFRETARKVENSHTRVYFQRSL